MYEKEDNVEFWISGCVYFFRLVVVFILKDGVFLMIFICFLVFDNMWSY